ncbi:AcrR family transcriptional regulator [Amycolatopsis bartoniae]|uniref:TetR family transcriptional regulator n=1 Tax=Amycolatopsis bartoniae TaxID=941986 RepID=A0A8H9IZC2_9PSEU|nr:TetR/AcrR family transcriptional regulator [Amycolatopsis bartoniae]MBB2936036.1 AcrR family transcriptional regulator [Amycolatopsis bartoniae]TVT00886.1 TetR family transcriptional regulator [Amycolatopsis bartoniae]GHF63668.1 TetR family transcriptional regulator [Amycolatopsis bartoniae]
MGRWEPNARERLVHAAVDLFAEQGYDNTTVSEIAQRAGLTKTTFFRHFPDKREVLFAGQEMHSRLLADGIAECAESATPLEAVAAGLDAVAASFTPVQREFGPRLIAVVTAHSELRERSAFKHAGLAAAMTEALEKRGVPDPAASLAAELGAHAFSRAFARWIEPENEESFPALARQALEELRAAVELLG